MTPVEMIIEKAFAVPSLASKYQDQILRDMQKRLRDETTMNVEVGSHESKRRMILKSLAKGETTRGRLVSMVRGTQSAVGEILQELVAEGLVQPKVIKGGRNQMHTYYALRKNLTCV